MFLVKRLIKRTGDMRNPDPTHKRFISLAWAAVLGNEETFEYLLNAGHDEDEHSRVRVFTDILVPISIDLTDLLPRTPKTAPSPYYLPKPNPL